MVWRDIAPGAQTERRGGAGPVRGLLGGKDPTGRFVRTLSRNWLTVQSQQLPRAPNTSSLLVEASLARTAVSRSAHAIPPGVRERPPPRPRPALPPSPADPPSARLSATTLPRSVRLGVPTGEGPPLKTPPPRPLPPLPAGPPAPPRARFRAINELDTVRTPPFSFSMPPPRPFPPVGPAPPMAWLPSIVLWSMLAIAVTVTGGTTPPKM